MGRLSSTEKYWKSRLEDQTLSAEEQKQAALELEKIKRRHLRAKEKSRHKKSVSIASDPKPLWYPLDGDSYPEYLEKLDSWERRHPEGDEEELVAPPVKTEAPKPAPLVTALPIEFACVDPDTLFAPKPAPAPKPVTAPKPVRVREPRDGWSGFFFGFWRLSADEQRVKLLRVNSDPGLKAQWDAICATMRAPREVLSPLSESEKAKAFAPPVVRPPSEVFPIGQPQTIDEARAPFQPTMANAKDAGISIAPDRRNWLPDIKSANLKPSR